MIIKDELFTMSQDWTDIGNVQVPKGMEYAVTLGTNPNGSEWDLGNPECIHLDETMLPPDEHHYLNEVGTCYHAFCNCAHKFTLYWPNVPLDGGEYKLELNLWGDYVDAGEDKPPVEDVEHTQVTLSFNDNSKSKFVCRNCEDVVTHTVTLPKGLYNIGFEVFVQWPQGGDAWANGMFIKSFKLYKLEDRYTIKVVKLAQESTHEMTQDVLDYVYDNKRTLTFSTDDSVRMLENEQGNERSYVEMVDIDMPSQREAISTFEALGIQWEELHV